MPLFRLIKMNQISSKTHEFLVSVHPSIRFTVQWSLILSILSYYTRNSQNSSKFLQKSCIVLYNSWFYLFTYLQTLSKYLEKYIFNDFRSFFKNPSKFRSIFISSILSSLDQSWRDLFSSFTVLLTHHLSFL